MGYLEFRNFVDCIPNSVTKYLVKVCYLLALRANEAASKGPVEYRIYPEHKKLRKDGSIETIPSQERVDTKPVGPRRRDVSYDSFEGTEIGIVKVKVLKRKESDSDNPIYRAVALPLADYEPWAKEIFSEFDKLSDDQPLVPFDRHQIALQLQESGVRDFVKADLVKKKEIDNPLRHERISHLLGHYHFEPLQLVLYVGWRMSTSLGLPSQVDDYAYLRWSEYIPKLMKNLPISRRTISNPLPLGVQP